MQFQYGSYFHSPNSVFFKSINRQWHRGRTGRKHFVRVNWVLEGKLLGSSAGDIQNQLAALQAAYAVDNQVAVMLDNNGVPTNWLVDTSQTIGGVIVTQPVNHEMITGAHGVTYLNYSVGLQWDVMWASPSDVLEFSETLSFSDNQGLPLQIERCPLNSIPIVQNVSAASLFYATQAGQMRQAGPDPLPPAPTYPGLFRGTPDSRQVSQLPIRAVRGTAIEFGVAWKYEFVSVTPFLGGAPNSR